MAEWIDFIECVRTLSFSNKHSRELSFKLTLQMIKSFQGKGILDESNPESYMKLLKAIVDKPLVKRDGWNEPHIVKRRPKTLRRMTEHRELYKNTA